MYGSNQNSKRMTVAAISLCAVVLALIVFSVYIYAGKRSMSDDFGEEDGDSTSYPVSLADLPTDSEGVLSPEEQGVSEEPVSSVESVASEVSSEAVSSVASEETKEKKTEIIADPDYKSQYYIVVYTGNQSIVVYEKNKKGKYVNRFMILRCSTGASDTPTKEGVYRIEKKEKWAQLTDNTYGQFGCLISKDSGLYISSTPYTGQKGSKMINEEYDKLGIACTAGGIQLCTRDARWIYINMPVGTQIHVVNADGPDTKAILKRKKADKYSGWDPTDKWSKGNPYFASSTTTTSAALG